ncbi:G-protein coupled receptor 161-like [Ptychodera flava]|uniref:G-protein coupled receptor 161-like n=1 Tax=Ptychodera flava TaxID=63121 RepID=UPI00396A411A
MVENDGNGDKPGNDTLVVVTVVYFLSAFFTTVGNLAALVVIVRTKELREVTRIFMANLAITDLLVGILILPFVLSTALTDHWGFGYVWCQFTGFCNLLLCSMSALSLTAVSCERFMVIVHPLRYVTLLTFRRSVFAIIFIWVYAALGASVPLFGIGRYAYFQERLTCGLDYESNLVFTVLVTLLYFALPVSWVFYIYFHIFKTARRHARSVHALVIGLPGHNVGFSVKERKATSTIFLIIGVYLATWTPFTVVQLVSMSISDVEIPREIDTVTTCLLFLNSACNPWIYCGMNSVFRQGLRRQMRLLLGCCCSRCAFTGSGSQNPSSPSTIQTQNAENQSVA